MTSLKDTAKITVLSTKDRAVIYMHDILLDKAFLFDGAMGTYFEKKSGSSIKNCETANISMPEFIEGIHAEYINAGAQAIRTNTFAANTISLSCDFSKVREIIEAAYDNAKKACMGKNTLVFADIGPIPQTDADNTAEYKRIIDVFFECGAKHFCFETFSEYGILIALSRYIKDKDSNAFVLTQFAVTPDGYTRKGISGSTILENISMEKSIDAYGFNCVSGPLHLLNYIKSFDIKGRPLCVMPNAGYPAVINERTVFSNNPDYFAGSMVDLLSKGVKIIGGCCGTTPEHIYKTAKLLKKRASVRYDISVKPRRQYEKKEIQNSFKQKLENGKKVIAVELDPPLDTDISYITQGSILLKEAGADIITVADNPLARARADSAIISSKIKREAHIDVLPHIACRDRNINAIKSLLLGLHIEDIRNVLVVTGDPFPETERFGNKGVFSFNSYTLAAFIKQLNMTVFEQDNIMIGAALNVNAQNFDAELKRAIKKKENGAGFFLTQSVFSEKSIENLKAARHELKLKILGGILPIVSHRNALFIKSEVVGMDIPDEVVCLYEGKSKEDCIKISVELCTNIARQISDITDGFYIMTPLKRAELSAHIVRQLKSELG